VARPRRANPPHDCCARSPVSENTAPSLTGHLAPVTILDIYFETVAADNFLIN
jgi:hypothetical protein